jgi:SAM-dependent methyltransferase
MMNLNASPGAADVDVDRLTADFRADRPLRMELEAIERILTNIDIGTLTCLDFGFANPVGSLSLRRLGGYWSTVVRTEEQCRNATALIGEDALQVGENFELPFDDKQFDVVVVARGHLTGDFARDESLIQECHRVLKTPGYLIISGDYRKRFNLAGLVSRQHDPAVNGGYDERQLFDLLKTGFDVLGVKTFCRFWVQVTRHMLDTHDCSKGRTTGFLFWVANQLDFLLFFAKGYQILAYGRRKGWRPRQPMGVHHGMTISESVLRRSRI